MKSSDTAARTASSTSRPKRVRFSRLPPYSSVRVLMAGSKNCSIRCPPNEVTSHPSQPQRSRRAAASAKRCTIAGISEAASGTGTSRWTPSGRSEGARSGMPVSVDVPRRPMCVICDMHRAPWPWTPSASARSAGSLRSSHREIEPYDAAVVGSTEADPNVITSAQPPAALRTW